MQYFMQWFNKHTSWIDFLHFLKHFHCESQPKEESEWRAGLRGWGGAFDCKGRGLDIKCCRTPERRSGRVADEEEKNVVEVASWELGACLELSGGDGAEVGCGRAQSSLWLLEWGVCGDWVVFTACSRARVCVGSASVWGGEVRASKEDVVCVCALQWEYRCRRSTAVRVKPFPQVSHIYGRSPVCERTCRWRSPDPAKHLPKNIKVHVITLSGGVLKN